MIGLAIGSAKAIDLAQARDVLAAVQQGIPHGDDRLQPLVPAVQTEIADATAEDEAERVRPSNGSDPLFRLHIKRCAADDGELATLVPIRHPQLRILAFDYDVAEFMGVRTATELAAAPTPRRSYLKKGSNGLSNFSGRSA